MPKRVFAFKSIVPSSWLNLIENHTHSDPTAEGAGGDISATVSAIANPLVYPRIGSTGPAGVRNRIRNPRFAINQRGVSGTVTLAAGAFGHDGWKAGSSGCTYTFSTTQNRTTLAITAGSLVQTLDGNDLAAGANTHTLSWGGTCQGKIGSGSYGAPGVTGSATGGTNINIEFNTGSLYEPQLELGIVASQFNSLSDDDELIRCRRFLPCATSGKPSSAGAKAICGGYANSTSTFLAIIPFIEGTRGIPTGIIASGSFSISSGSVNTYGTSPVISAATSEACGLVSFYASGLATGASGLLLATSGDAPAQILFTGLEI